MTEIVPFIFNNLRVRIVMIDGEPWFLLVDVCEVLHISNPRHVRTRLNPHDARTVNSVAFNDGIRGNPNRIVINESGLYDVILRSNRPEAIQFRNWVTSEVLPTIRKTGGVYIQPGSRAELDLTNPETALDTVQDAVNIARESIARAKRAEAAHAQELAAHTDTKQFVELLKPPAEAWLRLSDVDEASIPVAEAAKNLSKDSRINMGSGRLYTYMSEIGWIFRGGRKGPTGLRSWQAYQTHIDNGDLSMPVKEEVWNKTLERFVLPEPSVHITPQGLRKLHTSLVARVSV